MLEAAIAAAEELRSPIIIGTAEVLLPYGELKLIAPAIIEAAKRASVPVVVHYDHGLTFARCMEAFQLGFTSVMFDGSAGEYEENLKQTAEIVKIAHALGVTVEGEIGHVGQAASDDGAQSDRYTTPEEAEEYVCRTGVDALAVAIGTAHGAYKSKPQLDIPRLSQIRSRIHTPLVLHGGSGLSDDDFKNTIRAGIAKVNIFTDLCLAGVEGMKQGLADNLDYLSIRNKKVAYIKEAVKEKILLFGSQMLHHLVDFRESVQILTSQLLPKLLVLSDLFTNVLKLALVLCALHIAFLVLLCDILRKSCDIRVDLTLMISSDRGSEAEFFLCTHEKNSSVKILVPFIIPCPFAFFNKNFANS
jgi:fructose-bisphosphate aldolase class II